MIIFLIIVRATYSGLYESVYHEYATSEHQAARKDEFEKRCSGITAVEELRRCFNAHIKSGWETQRAQEDLYAQKEMAEWTFWTFLVAGFVGVPSVVATIWGIWLVVLNLREAKRVSRLAITSNRMTAKAMRATELASERELRAYIGISSYKIENATSGNTPTFHVEFKNFGNTPAFDVRSRTKVYPLARGKENFSLDASPMHRHGTINPKQESTINTRLPEGLEWELTKVSMRNKVVTLYSYGEIYYRDAFGKERETHYRSFWAIDDVEFENSDIFAICDDGNWST
tara:strand:+ start:670 stop:1530 length:861 start_codon:yes stop_codon:yes gene_type:complete